MGFTGAADVAAGRFRAAGAAFLAAFPGFFADFLATGLGRLARVRPEEGRRPDPTLVWRVTERPTFLRFFFEPAAALRRPVVRFAMAASLSEP
jgi:hypothetical protein